MPWKIVHAEGDDRWCVHKENDDKTPGEKVKCHDSEEKAKAHMKALYANVEEKEMQSGFVFAELKGDASAAFDGLPATDTLGYPLTDMRGNKVEIKKEDLPQLLENTQLAIESTRTESGEVVGLPIDLNNHDHQGGAGWIVGVELDAMRNVLRFIPRWTQAGLDLIKNDIRRFFSATFDPINRVIHGGSLTNSPATKNKRGQYLLRPIELSDTLFVEEKMQETINKTLLQDLADKFANFIASFKGDDKPEEIKGEKKMTVDTPVTPVAPVANPSMAELLNSPDVVLAMGKKAEEIAAGVIKTELRKKEIVEFASTLVGGTPDYPYGLPVRAEDVVSLLAAIDAHDTNLSKAVQQMLTKTMKATVSFMETGLNGEFNVHPRLANEYKPALTMWLEAGKDIKSFFAQNVELGSEKDYNLSEFIKAG